DVRIVQNFEIPFQHFLYKNEASNYVRCMYYDKDENYLLAGCIHAGQGNNGGIQLYDTSGNPLWENALFTDKVKNISNMEKLAKGKYLIMTSDQQGWFLLSLPEKKSQEFNWTASSQIRSQVYKTVWQNNVQRVNDSTIFIACSSNIYECVFRKTTLESITPVSPFNADTSNVITCFIYTTDHTFWIGTNAGEIYRYKNNEKLQMAQVPGNYVVRCFAEDSMHRVYVGTDKGIFVYENSLKLSGQITMQSGLLNDYIYAMLVVDRSSIFASTKLGLSFIPSNGEIKNYTSELGLQENEFNTQSALKNPNGKYFFGGINGITAFYPAVLSDVKDHPVLNITNLLINDSLYNFSPAVWRNDSIILHYDQNHLQFNFAALGFLNADEYIYKYRLKGFEENWQTTHQPNGIKYVLPPGNYTLELSCSPIFSSSSVFKKNIAIIVSPPWWQTWWFRISVIILSIGIIAFIVQQYNRRKYLKRIQAMQLQQNIQLERERISRDLHDNLGAYAAAIASNISVIKNSQGENDANTFNQLKDNSQSIINQLNDTIWALNREAILLTAISDRFKVFIQKIQSNYPGVKISVEEKIINDVKLSPTNSLHLFRIMQEALNNSVRHSGCTTILVQIISDADWKIIIRDDGKGFDILNVKIISGNGLRNMKIRAKEAGWNVSWSEVNPKGTAVIISSSTSN
ncbi:MAG: triple tyrosine motif-containing protein, partial [Chitinophagales bacterium]